MLERLRLLEDREAIRSLMFRYARAADAHDWEAWSLCWTEDAAFEYGPFGAHRGRVAIRDACSAAEAGYAAMQHSLTNLDVDVSGDRAEATAHLVFFGVPDTRSRGRHFDSGGPYRLEFERTPQGWRISRLELGVTWMSGEAPVTATRSRANPETG